MAALRVYDHSRFAFAGVLTMLRKLSEDSAHLLVPHVIQGKINSGRFGGLPHDGGWPVHRMMRWVVSASVHA